MELGPEELVAELDESLRTHRPAFRERLLPGVEAGQLRTFESRFGVALPPIFHTLYQWRNGQSEDSPVECLHGNLTWMPLDQIAYTKEVLDGMIGSDIEPGQWETSWVPFLSNGAGDHLCLDLVPVGAGGRGRVFRYYHDEEFRPPAFDRMEEWVEELIDVIERKQWGDFYP